MNRRFIPKATYWLCILLLGFPSTLRSQDKTNEAKQPEGSSGKAQAGDNAASTAEKNAEELRKASQNPIASLISVPIQNNSNFGIQPGYRTQDVLNIQPVIPLKVSKDWNLIIRWITPIIWQPLPPPLVSPSPEVGVYGLGDMQPSFFLSPSKPSKLIWGVGSVFQFPTATNQYLGQGKLGLGPTIVLLTQPGHWTIGMLANNVWSVAGSGGRPAVNQFLLQYFVNYNLKKGWYLTTAPILTANWRASSDNVWTVPFGAGFGRIMKIGFQPVNLQLQFLGNAVHPVDASPWGMRFTLAFLFPKFTKQQEKEIIEEKLKQLEQEQPQPQKK